MHYSRDMLKRFISYYKDQKLLFFMDLGAALLLAGIELIYPSAATRIIDRYIPNNMIRELLLTALLLFGLYLVMAGLNYFINYWGHVVGIRMEANMRADFFAHLQGMPFTFFDNNRTGGLMSRLVNDLNLIAELAHHGPEDLFISLVMFAGSFSVLVRQEWRLTVIIYFGIIPIVVWFAVTQRRKMGEGFRMVRERTADINAQVENSLSGARVAKSYTNEDYEITRFAQGNNLFRNAKDFSYKCMARFMTGMGFLVSMLNLSVLTLGGVFAGMGVITIGELTGFLLYINLVIQPVNRLVNFTQQFEQGMTGFARVHEIMCEKSDILDGPKELGGIQGRIDFEDVTFSYNESETVLSNVTLTILPGQTAALVGPSGGGKTTLCHLIPRFYDIKQGAIKIDGRDIREYTLSSLRGNIGLVQQDVFLFTGTIAENILYGAPDASRERMVEAAKAADIDEFIQSLPDKYDTYIGEKGVRLSGGQKQRISIARMFLKNPSVLLLDEATSALDNESEIKVQQALERLSHGRTTLIIAHRLSTIRNADIIFVMTSDGVVERGAHFELYARGGIYKRLYDAQFRIEEQPKETLY